MRNIPLETTELTTWWIAQLTLKHKLHKVQDISWAGSYVPTFHSIGHDNGSVLWLPDHITMIREEITGTASY